MIMQARTDTTRVEVVPSRTKAFCQRCVGRMPVHLIDDVSTLQFAECFAVLAIAQALIGRIGAVVGRSATARFVINRLGKKPHAAIGEDGIDAARMKAERFIEGLTEICWS